MKEREIPAGFSYWPQQKSPHSPADIIRLYASGFAGVWHDEAAQERLWSYVQDQGQFTQAAEVVAHNKLAEIGRDRLWLLFPAIENLFPGALPGPAQLRGDCVSHCSRNAALASLCAEIERQLPDEISGQLEGLPEISIAGVQQGVLSSEYLYWWRGHNGDGWDCASAAEMIQRHGMLVRQDYPQWNLDLTRYDARLAGLYGGRTPPSEIQQAGKLHVVRTVTRCQSYEEIRDLIAVGCGIASCGSEGFDDQRDRNGVSVRKGSWAHAMAYLGVDDRLETRKLYGEPLILVANSWGEWNRGPRTIRDTALQIPPGCFWARWSDVSRRTAIAYASIAGWPRQPLPDYGFAVVG